LSNLSLEELKELDENPVALKLFLRALFSPEPQAVETKEVRLIRMADQNLSELRRQITAVIAERRSLSEQVESKRATLLQQLDQFNATRESLRVTTSSIEEHRGRYSSRNLSDLMQQSSLADEEKSEKFAEKFLAGNLDVEQFVTGYIQVRQGHHKKKVAVEKLSRHRN
jgi:ESCRT-I complex subunit VPS37